MPLVRPRTQGEHRIRSLLGGARPRRRRLPLPAGSTARARLHYQRHGRAHTAWSGCSHAFRLKTSQWPNCLRLATLLVPGRITLTAAVPNVRPCRPASPHPGDRAIARPSTAQARHARGVRCAALLQRLLRAPAARRARGAGTGADTHVLSRTLQNVTSHWLHTLLTST